MPNIPLQSAAPHAPAARLPLRGWALEFARRWNAGAFSTFILHGNVFDLFPVHEPDRVGYVSLKSFLSQRIFPDRTLLLFYDIGDGLTFGSADMQTRFFEWLRLYDQVQNTAYHQTGLPRDFISLLPVLRRFFLRHNTSELSQSATLIIDFPEKLVPFAEEAATSRDERTALVTLLKWASSAEFRQRDLGIILVAESAAELHPDLTQNPHIAQIKIELPDAEERRLFLENFASSTRSLAPLESDLTLPALATRSSGLNLVRLQQLIAESVCNGQRLTPEYLSSGKRRLIEEYCQGLVRFKDPKPGLTLDSVATHAAAKTKLRELAWLIKHHKTEVLERGILVPGRVGVGKSFLIDCFASECGLPVLEIAEFRSKWVGDTERQQARILMTLRALGPVIVVVDEADAVFGTRSAEGDSGVSGRVFAAFAAHIGDSSLRGRELWIAMTSRPDLLAIDMKRQGRFGFCLPLFPTQTPDETVELFRVIAISKQMELSEACQTFIRQKLGERRLTGSDAEAILIRARERAVLSGRDHDLQLADIQEAVDSFIDPLDAHLLAVQELAAVLACSDRRYLPERYRSADRAQLIREFQRHRFAAGP